MRPAITYAFRSWLLSLTLLALCPLAQAQSTSEADYLPAPRVRQSVREILKDPLFQGFDHFDQDVKPGQARPVTANSATAGSGAGNSGAGNSGASTGRSGDRQNSPADETAPADATSPGNASSPPTRRSGNGEQPGGGSGNTRGQPSGSSSSSSGRPGGDSGSRNGSGSDASNPSNGNDANGNDGNGMTSGPAERPAPDRASGDSSADSPTNEPVRPERRPSSPTREATSTSARGIPSLRGSDGIERPVRFAPKPATAPERSWWEQDWDWGSFSGDLGAFGQMLGQLLQGIAYLAVAVVVALILVLVARAIADLIKSRQGKLAHQTVAGVPLADDHSPGEIDSDIYVQQAQELAQQGLYREALGRLVLGAMSAIEQARWIRYRRGLTLNDYLRSLRSHQESWAGFQAIVLAYEPVEFGRQTATSSGFESALNGYRQGFLRSGQKPPGEKQAPQ